MNMDLDPQSSEDVEKIVNEITGTPAAIVEKMKAITTMTDGRQGAEPQAN